MGQLDQNLNFQYQFEDNTPDFSSKVAPKFKTIYFPLCGISSAHLKSSISPYLSGDIKIDKYHYLTKPFSVEDLRQDVRNFYFRLDNSEVVSFTSACPSTNDVCVHIGQLWHKLTKTFSGQGLEIAALNFIPVSGENVELMRVKCTNISERTLSITPTSAVPLFGRSLSNKHDHEHVTSLLNRTKQIAQGVLLQPTMAFNEEGHSINEFAYFVFGFDSRGNQPLGTFPTQESFYGQAGSVSVPEAIYENKEPATLPDGLLQGKEAMGALRFPQVRLAPKEHIEYFILIGMEKDEKTAGETFKQFSTSAQFDQAFKKNVDFWQSKSRAVVLRTGNQLFNSWFAWVSIQPVFRRIFGNSFLPDHDYGKGGKGWRDIWQDLLSLILIESESVRGPIVNNFCGVRIDGSNATIVGNAPGEFVADRNSITRVWMDHGVWPFVTLMLYINQSGDFDILTEEVTYFRDTQMYRTYEKDYSWTPEYGKELKSRDGQIYKGSVIEHILVQHLVQFFNVGEHNITRLENADWNDGLDMAFARGESVAFMSFYAGNFIAIADLLETYAKAKKVQHLDLAKEVTILLDQAMGNPVDYNNPQTKRKHLFENYFSSVHPEVSGTQIQLEIKKIADDLRAKGNWVYEHINKTQRVEHEGKRWFNGYFDNNGQAVEGDRAGVCRMTLPGQVFPILSGLAQDADVDEVVRAVDTFLKDPILGGYRLNTDFQTPYYMELGRAFGFAYGTKENGAFFNHMNVMYAYALYKRGFAQQGHRILRSIFRMSTDSAKSKIYPGVPEYFDGTGRGRYHYLTGAASWMVFTMLTQVFGLRGEAGHLVLAPQLVKEEFDANNKTEASCYFAGKKVTVTFHNPDKLDAGQYNIKEVWLNKEKLELLKSTKAQFKVKRDLLVKQKGDVEIGVTLG